MNNGTSITAFVLLIFAVVAMLAVVAFSDGVRQVEWMDLESAGWACFGLALFATILGWVSFGRPLGKTTAFLGTLFLIGFVVQVMRYDETPSDFGPDLPRGIADEVDPAAE